MKIQELLATEDNWTQHNMATDKRGISVAVDDPGACAWCLFGAIRKCYPGREGDILVLAFDAITKTGFICGNVTATVTYWNDTHYRSFNEVKQLVKELDL